MILFIYTSSKRAAFNLFCANQKYLMKYKCNISSNKIGNGNKADILKAEFLSKKNYQASYELLFSYCL